MSILDWSEAQVNQFFVSLGLNRFESAINEHGLTGDVLVHLDNELLKDIGIQSVGKRLVILKAIYKLKIQDDIPIEDGQWVPPLGDLDQNESDDTASPASILTPPHKNHFTHLIQARDEKIKNLESEIRSIKLELQSFAARLMSSTPTSPSLLESSISTHSVRGAHGRHMREESVAQLDIPDPSPASPPIITLRNQPTPSHDESRPPRTESPTPSTLTTSQEPPLPQPTLQDPVSSSIPSSVSATPKPKDSSEKPDSSSKQPDSSAKPESSVKPDSSAKPDSSVKPDSSAKPDSSENKDKSSKEKDSSNPYKSFRVTLEDPCYKVLPAALKKYKIKEHYKNYVLFICYGKQERCLSYDEKPLLLFQKLKDAHQNPVFTLRHIKDIESPVSLALAKHAQRREKRLASEAENQDSTNPNQTKSRKTPPNMGQFDPACGFCIAIYPYMPEGKDDLDVGVGDTFIIVGKSKGWWVVNRDQGPDTKISQENQGWIPSGCLLETNQSFTIGTTGKINYETKITPDQVLSVSTACYGLMDFVPKGSDELGFEINDSLKVYKKYNNWSYAINESKPDKPRGWTPSWLIGTRKDKESQSTQSQNQQLQVSSPNSIQTSASGSSSNFGSSSSSITTTTNNHQQLHSGSIKSSRTLHPSPSRSSIISNHTSLASTTTTATTITSVINNKSNSGQTTDSLSSSTISSFNPNHQNDHDKLSDYHAPPLSSSSFVSSINTSSKNISTSPIT